MTRGDGLKAVRTWKKLTKRQAVVFCLLGVGAALFLNQTTLLMNRSGSLPHKAFLVLKGWKPERGDYVTFTLTPVSQTLLGTPMPEALSVTPVSQTRVSVTKQVVGVAGDVVRREGNHILVGDRAVGPLLKETADGLPLTPLAFEGMIPQGHVFVATTHERSFDSRYAEMGLITEACFLGKAIPLL